MLAGIDGASLVVRFSYSPDLVVWTKNSLTGRRFVKENGGPRWIADLTKPNVDKVREKGFQLDQALCDWIKASETKAEALKAPDVSAVPTTLPLRSYQREGVAWIQVTGGRAMIADEMGLGKSLQALAWIQWQNQYPTLIVCPASVCSVWQDEVAKWLRKSAMVLRGKRPPATYSDVCILSVDSAANLLPTLKQQRWQCVVVDECHTIKNTQTARAQAVRELSLLCRHVICLSGTPITNRPAEYWSALNLLQPRRFPSYWPFLRQFCDLRQTRYGWEAKGATNVDELRALTADIVLRRKKADVAKDLPEKTRQIVRLAADLVSMDADVESMDQISRVRAMDAILEKATLAKVDAACSWIKEHLEASASGKLVVFTAHHAVTDAMRERLGRDLAVFIDGRNSADERERAIKCWRAATGAPVLVGSIPVIGQGWTLTEADAIAFVEYPWTPGMLDQCEDRIHRIGQTRPVTIYYLVGDGCVDEHMFAVLDEKRKVLEHVLDGKAPAQDEKGMMQALMERLAKYGTAKVEH